MPWKTRLPFARTVINIILLLQIGLTFPCHVFCFLYTVHFLLEERKPFPIEMPELNDIEVFALGSFPLKTYLPDGDVDLTALSRVDEEEDLAQTVCDLLQSGEDPEYQVQDVQYIRAQVPLVKCTIKGIAVDISFNQMPGLYTLRFLEQVDQLVGKNYIFKRSIILIKAWCYYESRLLGGHFGLLTTYALEILVLYIINRFHSSVRGPLEVLYIFLDYYRSFDWEHNYISIWGPRALSSLPEIVDIPECDRGQFLLQKEFLQNYKDMCSSFTARASENVTQEFSVKSMNILDPLRDDNNVGRSVTMASLYRMRLAFSYGSKKLKKILKLPGQYMGAALEKFFRSTLDRNGKGQRADVDIPVSPFGTGRSEESVIRGDCNSYYGALQYIQKINAKPPLTENSSFSISPSQDHIPALSMQQHWSMFYPSGTEVYIPPEQTLYHPTYEGGMSRGTGTYIPDLNYNCYWDIRARASRPRRFVSPRHYEFPTPPVNNQQEEEVHSEKDMSGNSDSRSLEISSEDFPLLSNIPKATPATQAQESSPLAKAHSETDMGGSSRLSGLSKEYFPLFPGIHKATTPPTQVQDSPPLAKAHSETNMGGDTSSFSLLSDEYFPLLPSTHKATPPTQAQEVALLEKVQSETQMETNSKWFELSNEDFPLLPKLRSVTHIGGNSSSFELSKEEFPLLSSTRKTTPSESTQLTKQGKSSLSSKLKNVDFGTLSYKNSQALAEPSLSTKGEKGDSGVSLSQDTVQEVPKVAVKMEEESAESYEKWIDSI
ncbi:uncharacterized protein LOC109797664 isoform X2 [Cajanus cajan]|uniref:uncharacterized protein LOC109797664 isoform X2 n=1 Tax=Cajanus cajan TaxID=3821 RepID=UPI0010FBB9C7|nr:uncharacterized protein LOC109797664 isoform X2 [Cajanus cajan]